MIFKFILLSILNIYVILFSSKRLVFSIDYERYVLQKRGITYERRRDCSWDWLRTFCGV